MPRETEFPAAWKLRAATASRFTPPPTTPRHSSKPRRRNNDAWWQLPNVHTAKGRRDRAILAMVIGCGLRRRELIDLTVDHLQRREDHWAIVDLGKKRAYPYSSDA